MPLGCVLGRGRPRCTSGAGLSDQEAPSRRGRTEETPGTASFYKAWETEERRLSTEELTPSTEELWKRGRPTTTCDDEGCTRMQRSKLGDSEAAKR
ncbi:hypothetical protein NDU88_006953 [Pleurodeles waltl]|uniref:Uncharacterized protein n=1 Tax=Pleurodeles waltl TaxID=8319 RepID=A0AAV7QLI8_PLEWA|nr:hypothetical protein NDU88_006953 [Pleurodeles waltl]